MKHIHNIKYFLDCSLNEEILPVDLIKPILFSILNKSEWVEKFDYVWSPNLSVGSPILHINNLSEYEFFDETIDLFDLISELWPYGKEDYYKWKKLYYGLVCGYVIKDKSSEVKLLVQIVRFNEGFNYYINPNYRGESSGEKVVISDEIINVFSSSEETYPDGNFAELGIELRDKIKTVEDVKRAFRYLDAVKR